MALSEPIPLSIEMTAHVDALFEEAAGMPGKFRVHIQKDDEGEIEAMAIVASNKADVDELRRMFMLYEQVFFALRSREIEENPA